MKSDGNVEDEDDFSFDIGIESIDLRMRNNTVVVDSNMRSAVVDGLFLALGRWLVALTARHYKLRTNKKKKRIHSWRSSRERAKQIQ